MSIRELASFTRKTKGCIPPKLVGASTTVVGDCVYLLGGRASTEQLFHIYIFNLSTQTWTKIPQPDGPAPPPRYLHSTDLWNGYLVVFGGIAIDDHSESSYVLDDIWFFSILESCWILSSSESSKPFPRYGHLSSISADTLFIIGGQDKSDNWIDDMHLYDLKSRSWVHCCSIPYHCGTYRGLAAFSNLHVIDPSEEGYGPPIRFKSEKSITIPPTPPDNFVELTCSAPTTEERPSETYMYLNYNFTDLRRELRLYKATNNPQSPFTFNDLTSDMHAKLVSPLSTPPALRFPTGGIIGTYLVLSGVDFTTRHTMAAWALNLQSLTWMKIEMSSSLSKGSWSRGVVWPSSNKLVIFGSCEADFKDDYQNRLLSWSDVVCIDLEAYGIYQPPPHIMTNTARAIGLAALEDGAFADFEVVCNDGRGVACSRELLQRRWNWFHEERKKWDAITSAAVKSDEVVLVPPLTFPQTFLLHRHRPDPRFTPRRLHLPEPYPVVVAFLQYLYTQSLMTPLQHAPAVLSALMLLAATYDIPRLMDLVAHAMHGALDRSREFASGIFDVASLVERSGLRLRAFWIGRRPNRSCSENVGPREGPDSKDSHQPSCRHVFPRETLHQSHNPNCTQPPSWTDYDPDHKDETRQLKDHNHRSHVHPRSTTPPSVPVSAVESPTDLSSTTCLVDDGNDKTWTEEVQSDKKKVGVSIRQKKENSMSAFIAAILDFGNNDSFGSPKSPQFPHGRVEKDKPDKSEAMVMQNDELTQVRLHHSDTRVSPINASSIPSNLATSNLPISSGSRLETLETESHISQIMESRLRHAVHQALGSVASGPYWKNTGGTGEVNENLPKNETEFNPSRISPSRIRSKRLTIGPRCTPPSTEASKLLCYPSKTGPLTERGDQAQAEDKGKGDETKRDQIPNGLYLSSNLSSKVRYVCPASAAATIPAGPPSIVVAVRHRVRSTTVPQAYTDKGDSAGFYHSARHPVPLQLANLRTPPSDVPQGRPTQLISPLAPLRLRNQTRDHPPALAHVLSNGTTAGTRRSPLPTPPQSESEASPSSNSPSFSSDGKTRPSSRNKKGIVVEPSEFGSSITMASTTRTIIPKSTMPFEPLLTRRLTRPRPLPSRPNKPQIVSAI